jgi:S-adenosylmethionine hydrolase
MNLITLTTDFGTSDWFVGSMKGVILAINPHANIVDLSHHIASGDVRAGAFVLAEACRLFPRNTVHVAVIDPGVGSDRAAIAVHTSDCFFVGPDNGVLSLALAHRKVLEIRRLDNEGYFHKPVSHTFHGRDIFAPVAARLTMGVTFESLGTRLTDYAAISWAQPFHSDGALCGEVLHVDQFGNAITNLDARHLPTSTERTLRVFAGDREIGEVCSYYQQVPQGQSLGIVGSTGLLEIAINGGDAAQTLGLKIGDPVQVL